MPHRPVHGDALEISERKSKPEEHDEHLVAFVGLAVGDGHPEAHAVVSRIGTCLADSPRGTVTFAGGASFANSDPRGEQLWPLVVDHSQHV